MLPAGLAAADRKPKLSDADRKTCHDQLATGRQLTRKKQYKQAVAAYEVCIKLVPDEATVLAERGFTAYLAHDYKLAEASTRGAMANQTEPSLLGAAAYNLGLIEEARGDKPAAVAAYTQSLKARPHSVVRAALRKLDPAAAAALDPFVPKPMAGPFASVDAYCKTLAVSDDEWSCSCGRLETGANAKGYLEIAAIEHKCKATASGSSRANQSLAIAVHVAKGWYAVETGNLEENLWCVGEVLIDGIHPQDIAAGGTTELYAALGERGSCTGGESMRNDEWKQSGMLIFGLSSVGVPHATPAIVLTRSETHADDSTPETVIADIALTATWKGNALELSGKTRGLEPSEARNLVGSHVIVFP